MSKFLDFLLDLLIKFGGGSGKVEDNLVRFGLAALFWGVLLAVAWSRQRQHDLPREKLLIWGFGLGYAREMFMFSVVAAQMMGLVKSDTVYIFFPPLELALGMASVTVVAASFLRYILDDADLSRRYLQIGLSAVSICYLATFWWWASHVTANPEIKFFQTWAAWLLRLAGAGLTAIPIVLLIRKRGWLRNIVLVALTFFFLDEFLMLVSLTTRGVYKSYLCPISHNFHLWTIPVLGYVYIREQSIERKRAQEALRESE